MRLRKKTRVSVGSNACASIGGDVNIGDLPLHRETIVAVVLKHPAKRASALSAVLAKDYGLVVKWKALETYCLREQLWIQKPRAVVAVTTMREKSPASSAAMIILWGEGCFFWGKHASCGGRNHLVAAASIL